MFLAREVPVEPGNGSSQGRELLCRRPLVAHSPGSLRSLSLTGAQLTVPNADQSGLTGSERADSSSPCLFWRRRDRPDASMPTPEPLADSPNSGRAGGRLTGLSPGRRCIGSDVRVTRLRGSPAIGESASRTNAGTPACTTLHRAHAGFAMPVSTKSRAAALVLSPGAKGICPVPVRAAAASSSQLGFARLSQRLSASRPTSVTSPLGAIQSRARSSPTKPTG